MATNDSTTVAAVDQLNVSSSVPDASSATAEVTPAPKCAVAESTVMTSPDLESKITDPTLRIITVDPHYDLTLIVGSPGRINGQVAFRVNKGSLRHASNTWTKILNGPWADGNQAEIKLPDDCAWAFHQALRIAHLQIDTLPNGISLEGMRELAVLTDKYDLVKLMRVALASKQWLHTFRCSTWYNWPADPSLQEWTFITQL